jgi:orotate phosphoribosyltransferase-like protein
MNELQRKARVDRARRLRGEGLSYEQIGDKLGVAGHTIHCWLDADFLAKTKESQRRSRAKMRAMGVGSACSSKPRAAALQAPPAAPSVDDRRDRARRIVELKARGFSRQAIAARLRVPYLEIDEALR